MICLQSSGALENDERTAGILMNMVRLASRVKINADKPETFKRLSGKSLFSKLLLVFSSEGGQETF